MSTLLTTTRRWFVAGMVAVVAAGPIAGIASAAQAHPAVVALTDQQGGDNRGGGRADAAKAELARVFARQQKEIVTLGGRLERANKRADRVAKWIGEATAKGKDTAALSTALDTFRSQIKAAQGTLAEAKVVSDAHAGFDANGKVTDVTAAKATVEGTAKKMQQTRETLRQAYQAMRKAIADWRKANPKTADPQVPSEE